MDPRILLEQDFAFKIYGIHQLLFFTQRIQTQLWSVLQSLGQNPVSHEDMKAFVEHVLEEKNCMQGKFISVLYVTLDLVEHSSTSS
ncbi:hypothetical protein KIN20_022512 [Parelaphostrongylus tenuis]|uniref:Uncharacterized protein n=1 Tax=Parelaphostrongylus tenuis TaxID=148309 RepID=A0AAD5N5N6_PARTN|nr:hypothetical protein KIN20_022512 [Parelaphostrongylus tenuis]